MSASRFPHTARQGKEQFVASAPKALDERFDYTRVIKCANRVEERVLRKQRTARVIGILDKSAAAINAELAREAAEAERLSRDFWRNFKRQVKPEETQSLQKRKPQIEEGEPPIWFRKLPSYDHDIVDSMGLTGVFAEFKYLSAPRTSYGVAKRLVYYITKPESIEYLHDGSPAVLSNIGVDRDENATFMSMLEDVHRGSRANAKIVVSAILQLPYDVTTETRLDIMREWCEENLGVHDLPYVAGLHPPSHEGDQRNFHAHVVFSYRPMRQYGRYDWDLNRFLRTDLDGPHFFTILRSNFARTMTHHVQMAGMTRTYTGLSNAARGLVNKPVQKMGAHKVRAFRDGEYVLDVDRTEALIAMNVRREMAYEALQNKVLEEIDMRFDDIASGAYYERHRPRPFLPIPAAKLGLPHRDRTMSVANSAAPVLVSPSIPVPAKIVTLPLVPKLLCPKPAAAAAENVPKTSLKLPVAFVLAETPPLDSRKLLMPVRVIAPTLPVEPRSLQPMIPVDISTPDHKPQTLNLPSHVRAVKYENVRAQFLMPAKVSPPHLTSTKPMLPIAAGWSALPAQTQISKLKCPLSASPVSLAAQPPILKASTPAHVSPTQSERPSLRVPSPARPIPVKPSLAKPRIPVRAVLPQTNPHDTPLLVPIRSLSFPQLGTSITHPQKLMLPIRAAELSSGDAPREPLKVPIKVVFIDSQPLPQPPYKFRDYVMIHEAAALRAGKNTFADENERMLKDVAKNEAASQSTTPIRTTIATSPQPSPTQTAASQSASTHASIIQSACENAKSATRSSQPSSATPSKANTSAPKPILTFEAFQRAIVAEDCFIIFDQFNNFTPSRAAMKKMNVDPHLIHIPGMQYWLEKQKMAQDEWLHSLVLAQKKPVRTRFDFDLDKIPPVSRRRLKLWATDPECSHQYTYRMLRVMAVFGTDSSRAARNSDVELQLYSSGDLYNTILHAEPHRYPDVNLAEILHLAAKEVRLFVGSLSDGYQLKRDANTMLWPCLDVCKRDPALMRLIHQTIHLTKCNGKPKYPIEVESAMTVYDAERADPQLAKQTLYCPLWTRVECGPPKVRSSGMIDYHQQQRQLDQDLGPTRGD